MGIQFLQEYNGVFHEFERVSKKLNTQPGTAKATRRLVNNAIDIGRAAGGNSKNPSTLSRHWCKIHMGLVNHPNWLIIVGRMLAGFWKECGLVGTAVVWNMKAGVCIRCLTQLISRFVHFPRHANSVMLLSHHNQSECKANMADKKKKI